MEEKIILDLCGGTGSWSKPYKDAGYNVIVITLPKYNIFDIQLSNLGLYIKDNDGFVEFYKYKNIVGILAAPTCTMFSLARTTAKEPRDFEEGMKLVKCCLDIIWKCRANGNLKFWALENPLGYMRQFLGKPSLTFSPNDYGDNYTKQTDLWGYFNIPTMFKRELTDEEKAKCKINNRTLPELPENYILPKGWNVTAAKRSMTSKHFAEAFFKANN